MIALFILMLMSSAFMLGSNQEYFLKGQELYEQREYGKALESYDVITNKGPATWYNMGNCAYHMKRYDDACVYWLRARKGATKEQVHNIKTNIDLVSKAIGTSIDVAALETPLYYIPLVGLQVLFFALWILFFWVTTRRHPRKKETLLLLVLAIILVSYLLVVKYRINHRVYAMVQKDQVAFFAGPNTQYHTLGSLRRYDMVMIDKHADSWCKISCGDQTGWIPAQDLVVL